MTVPIESPEQQVFSLLPTPVRCERASGEFCWTSSTQVVAGTGAERAALLVQEWIVPHAALSTDEQPRTVVSLDLVREGDLPSEGFRLTVTPDQIELVAADHAGLVYGIQAIRQLLPPSVYAEPGAPIELIVPCCSIEDYPRFGWRGVLLDPARWFLPVEFLFRFVDAMSMHRLNVLHLHLSDDQGWRFEVLKYPRLTEVGAWRDESPFGHRSDHRYDGIPHGGFYRQSELRELVAYAADRGVTIVPEIDLPGHTTAMIAAYPELGNNPDADVRVSRSWLIHGTVLNMEQSTVDFCTDVLTELLDVFPGRYIHLGGDECPRREWERSRRAQARAAELGLDSVGDLQNWFMNELNSFLRSRGRQMICWDDVLGGPIDDDVAIMFWRDPRPVVEAAHAGHEIVLSPGKVLYLDMYQSTEPGQPIAFGGLNTLKDVFDYDADLPGLREESADRVRGVQGQLWGEYMPTPERVEDMAFPRLCALAEVGWSTEKAPFSDFVDRLTTQLERLDRSGIGYRPPRPDLVDRPGTTHIDPSIEIELKRNI